MKLSFFEKNLFDKQSREKPILRTNDTATGLEKIRDDFTDQYVSSELNRSVRQIKIPVEYLPFYTDGEKFYGDFKKTEITSGEPEIISNVSAPAKSQDINITLEAQARLANLLEGEQAVPKTEVRREGLQFEPKLNFSMGNISFSFLNGFADVFRRIRTFGAGGPTNTSAYYRIFNQINNTLPGNPLISENQAHEDFKSDTPASELPPELFSKTITVPVEDNTIYRRVIHSRYGISARPDTENYPPRGINPASNNYEYTNTIKETIYFKIVNLRKQIHYSYREYSLNKKHIIIPVVQNVQYYGGQVLRVTKSGDLWSYGQLSSELQALLPRFYLSGGQDFQWFRASLYGIISTLYVNAGSFSSGLLPEDQAPAKERYKPYFVGLNSSLTNGYLNGARVRIAGYNWTLGLDHDRLKFNGGPSNEDLTDNDGNVDTAKVRSINLALVNWLNFTAYNQSVARYFYNQNRAIGRSDYPSPQSLKKLTARSFNEFQVPAQLLKSDLGVPESVTTLKANGQGIAPLNFNYRQMLGDLIYDEYGQSGYGSITRNGFFRLHQNPLNMEQIKMEYEGYDNQVSATENLKNLILPIRLNPPGDNAYDIVDINFHSGTNFGDVTIVKADGTEIERDDITEILYEVFGESPNTINVRDNTGNPPPVFDGRPGRTFKGFPLVNILKYRFRRESGATRTGLTRQPTMQNWIDAERVKNLENVKKDFLSLPLHFFLAVLNPQNEDRQRQINLLEQIEGGAWPWVQINNSFYNEEEQRIYLIMSRTEHAPVPNKSFFKSVRIAGRNFSFGNSRYNAFPDPDSKNNPYKRRVAEYSWRTNLNFLRNKNIVPLIFKKSGTSYTSAFEYSRQIRKSTVKTITKKQKPVFLGGFKVKDFDFDISKFEISFEGVLSASDFQSIAVKSADGLTYITRELRSSDANVASLNGITNFKWENLPDFYNLRRNKLYVFEMIKGANNSENRFFVPRPGQTGFHFIKDLALFENNLDFELVNFGAESQNQPFLNVALLNKSGTSFITQKPESSALKSARPGGWEYSFAGAGQGLRALVAGDKFDLLFTVEDYPELDINIVKMTDIFFDSLVILNTNLDDIQLYDSLGNELIHPAEVETFKSENENGLRHIVLFLSQPVTAGMITLKTRRINGSDKARKIGQIIAMKKIGQFSQFPRVRPTLSHGRVITKDQQNRAHVKGLAPALNYSLVFPPLQNPADWRLAQDLFSRVADYNEFVVWVSGGDIIPDRPGIRGFQFTDIVKCLCGNDDNIVFADDRVNSGVNFEMRLLEVQ